MTENQEPKSESEGTEVAEPEKVVAELSHPKETIIEPLAPPYRAVIWLEYDELKERLDGYWKNYGQAILAKAGVKARNPSKARKIAEKEFGYGKLYGAILQDIVYKEIGDDVMFLEGMQLFNFKPGADDLHLVAVFYYVPDLEPKEEIDWKVQAPPIPPEEEERDRRLKQIQRQYRTVEDAPEGAVIDESSEIMLDLTTSIGGEPYPLASFQGQWLEWKTLHYNELKEALLGHKAGDLFETQFPARFDSEVNGKTVDAVVKIHALRVITYPEIDDDLAKDDGYDSLDHFNEIFHRDYDRYTQNAQRSAAVEHLVQQFVLKSDVPMFPQEWVDRNIDRMIAEHTSTFDGNKRKARQALHCESDKDMRDKFRGQLYSEYLHQLAARSYCKKYGCGDPGSEEMFEHMLQHVEWRAQDGD